MDKQEKLDYLNKKCEAFPDCEGCPVFRSEDGRELCKTIAFEDMDEEIINNFLEKLNSRLNVLIPVSNEEPKISGIGRSCLICNKFIPICYREDDIKICPDCIKKLRILLGVEQNTHGKGWEK